MDVPSGWVQIIRGPRPPSQRWPKSHMPAMFRHARVGPAAARDLAKNKIVQLERALEALGGMEGPAVQAIKLELEKARSASKKPPFERGDRGGPKVHHSFPATSEGDGGRASGGGTFVVEEQENLKRCWQSRRGGPATQYLHRT